MYAIIADYSAVEIIKMTKDPRTYYKTGLLTVFDEKGLPSGGYYALGSLLATSLIALGFEPVDPPQIPIVLKSPEKNNTSYKVDNLIPIRVGTKKRAYLWKAAYQVMEGVKKRRQENKSCILKYSKEDTQVQNEIDKLQYLEHPSIPKLLAAGHIEELGYAMIVEPVGVPIKELPNNSVDQIWKYMEDVNDALCYAHEKETFHCDVSPKNIIVVDEGAILIDWGIAIDFTFNKLTKWMGTSSFCSLAVLKLRFAQKGTTYDYQPRDDFESLFYTILQLLSQKNKPLPWTKTREFEALYNSKYMSMHIHWDLLLRDNFGFLPAEIAKELDAMHAKLFKDSNAPVDSLF